MMKQTKNIIAAVRKQGASVLLLACVPLAFASCIDEDLSECGVDYAIDYRLELSTSLRLSLDQELVTPAERQLAEALKSALSDIITDKAKVVDLSFFTFGNGKLTKHQTFNPDANSLSLTVYMDRGDYHNIALAATQQEDEVRIDGASTFSGINLRQVEDDTIDAHSAALYMGYEQLLIDQVSSRFYVPLYMQNAVPVLVVNPNNSPARLLSAYTRRTASGLQCADSTFVYDHSAVMRTRRVEGGGLTAYYTVCFPSADTPPQGRAADNPAEAQGSIWEMDVYTQLSDEKYVKNTLYIKDPLKAGEMQVIKVKLTDDGELVSDNPEVGVSVELDWKPGGDFEVEI